MSKAALASFEYPATVKTSTRRIILAAAALLLCLLVGGTLWWNATRVATPGSTAATPTPASVGPRGTSTSPAASPSPSESKNGDLAGCTSGTEIMPNHFDVPARGLSESVIPVGQEPDGAIGAPPLDQKFTLGVWSSGPKIGSTKGNVIGTAHTWTGAIGLGNVVNGETGKGLQPGDVIRFTDGTTTVCYIYREKVHFTVASYDENSTMWINPEGKPQFTIMICDDFNTKTQDWDSRIIFYADLVA